MSIFYTDSGSIQQLVVSSSLFVSGSTTITGSLNLTGNITTPGTITAQTLVVQTITSSISNITGSTKFGTLLSNTHQFTGSIYITGSSFNFNNGIGNYVLSNYTLITPSSFLINSQGGYLKLYNSYHAFLLGNNPEGYSGIGIGFSSSPQLSASLHISSSNTTKSFLISTPNNPNVFTIIGNGKVGINTINPFYGQLEISTGSLGTHAFLAASVLDGTYNPRFILSHVTATSSHYIKFDSSYSSGTGFANWTFINGNVGIGTTSPATKVEISGLNGNPVTSLLTITDTTAFASGTGGGITFKGVYTGTSATEGAGIRLEKANATDGNYSFNLAFYTRANGIGNFGTSKMIIGSDGITYFQPTAEGRAIYLASPGGSAMQLGVSTTGTTRGFIGYASQERIILNSNGTIQLEDSTLVKNYLQVTGAGATSSTTNFLLRNSSTTSLLSVLDNGKLNLLYSSFDGDGGGGQVWTQSTIGSYIAMRGSTAGMLLFGNRSIEFVGYMGNTSGTSVFKFSSNGGLNPATGTTDETLMNSTWYPATGTAIYNQLALKPAINTTGSYVGVVRGIYYNPTLTSVIGVTHYAFESTSGGLLMNTDSTNSPVNRYNFRATNPSTNTTQGIFLITNTNVQGPVTNLALVNNSTASTTNRARMVFATDQGSGTYDTAQIQSGYYATNVSTLEFFTTTTGVGSAYRGKFHGDSFMIGGIASDSPGATFTVKSAGSTNSTYNTSLVNSSGQTLIYLKDDGTMLHNGPIYQFGLTEIRQGNSLYFYNSDESKYGSINYNADGLFINSTTTLRTYITSNLTVGESGANVNAILDVQGNSDSLPIGLFRAPVSSATSTNSSIQIESTDTSIDHGIIFSNGTNTDATIFQTPSTGKMTFSVGRTSSWGGYMSFVTDTVERINVSRYGNVVINAPTSGIPLTVTQTRSDIDAIRIINTIGTYSLNNYNFNTPSSFLLKAAGYLLLSSNGNNLRMSTNDGVTDTMTISTDGNVGISNGSPSYKLDVSGSIRATSILETSSERYKTDIYSLPSQLDLVQKLNPVTFKWKNSSPNSATEYGLIAEEVLSVIPEVVSINSNGDAEAISYTKLVPILIKSIQELQIEIQELKSKIV